MHACDATEEHTRRHSEGIKSWFKSLIMLPCGKACTHLHFEDNENKCVTLSCERNPQPLLNKSVFTLHGSQVQMFFCYFKVGRRRLLRAKLLNSTVIRFDCFDLILSYMELFQFDPGYHGSFQRMWGSFTLTVLFVLPVRENMRSILLH